MVIKFIVLEWFSFVLIIEILFIDRLNVWGVYSMLVVGFNIKVFRYLVFIFFKLDCLFLFIFINKRNEVFGRFFW